MAKKKDARIASKYWWMQDDEKLHEAIIPIVKHLKTQQNYRTERNLLHMRLYGNQNIAGATYNGYFRDQSPTPEHRIKLNVVKSVIDTVQSKLCKNRPKPMFLTDGGDFSKKRRAQKLNKYVEGALQGMKIWDLGPDLVRDMGVFDIAAWKFYTKGGKVCVERSFPEEILVDEMEGFYRDPRSLFQPKSLAREVVLSSYPEHEADILQVGKSSGNISAANMTDLIDVVEAWHLPTDGEDGKHAIVIGNKTIFAEEYKLEKFPFVFARFSDRLVGWYGQGIAEQLVGIQIDINKINKTIQECMKWSVPKVFVQHGTSVTPFSNLIMGMYKYTGAQAPKVEAVNTIPRELLMQRDYLYQKAFEIIGVSQLSAQSQKPAGLDSGKALREFTDIESDRFVVDGQRYEQAYLDAADVVIALTEEMGGGKVNYQGQKGVAQLDWKDVKMARDEFSMTMWPTNLLSSSPAGKLQDVQEMLDAGLLSPEEGKRLLNYPDVESVMSLQNAPLDIMDDVIEKILDGGWEPPEPYFKFDIAIPAMQNAYLRAKLDGAEEQILENLRRWIDQAMAIVKQMSGQSAPTPTPTEPPPQPQEAMPPAPPANTTIQ